MSRTGAAIVLTVHPRSSLLRESKMEVIHNIEPDTIPNIYREQSYSARDLTLQIAGRELAVRVLSPKPESLSDNPLLLLSFAADKETSLDCEPYNLTAKQFLESGHRVLSFDLPSHGSFIDENGEGIQGFRNAFIWGKNSFELFLKDALTVIDHCIVEGLAQSGRIVVSGTSRAGYLALRLLAADARVAAAAVYAPVTDWRDLTEFAAERERDDLAATRLSEFADGMVGRPIFIVIGNHDERVSTASCCQFYLDLVVANRGQGKDDSHLNFQIQDVPGHASQPARYLAGADFLLQAVSDQ